MNFTRPLGKQVKTNRSENFNTMEQHIEELIKQKFGKVIRSRNKENQTEYRINCPECGNKKHKMYLNPDKGTYNCFVCGAGRGKRLHQLLGKFKSTPPAVAKAPEPMPRSVEPPGYMIRVDQLPLDHVAIEYLTKTRSRPFRPSELSRDFNVHYCNDGKSFPCGGARYTTSNSLIFPVYMSGTLIGWQSRLLYDPKSLTDSQCGALGYTTDEDGEWLRPPKYYTNPGLKKGEILYNYDAARKHRHVVVVEGVFDAFSVGTSSVAIFGKNISETQARMLKSYWDAVIVLLDPGDASEQASDLVADLHRSVPVLEVTLSDGKDPGDSTHQEIWQQIADEMSKQRMEIKSVRRSLESCTN
jgi:hypothetical protein